MMDIGEVGKNNNSHRSSGEAQGTSTPSSEFVLQWGNRKRLRCMKIHSASHRTKLRINSGNTNITTFRRPSSPPPPPPFSRNFESMKGQSSNGGMKEEKVNITTTNNNGNGVGGASGSSETSKKGGSSSGSEAIPVWLPKFVIALTNKEKEEDFMAIKGSKLPQRPKKRAKFLQRTLNLVSPGAWLCDLTLERYEVREKKISNKRPRGLKAMGNMDTDSD